MGHLSPAEKTNLYKRVIDQRGCIQKGGNTVSKGLNENDVCYVSLSVQMWEGTDLMIQSLAQSQSVYNVYYTYYTVIVCMLKRILECFGNSSLAEVHVVVWIAGWLT